MDITGKLTIGAIHHVNGTKGCRPGIVIQIDFLTIIRLITSYLITLYGNYCAARVYIYECYSGVDET